MKDIAKDQREYNPGGFLTRAHFVSLVMTRVENREEKDLLYVYIYNIILYKRE